MKIEDQKKKASKKKKAINLINKCQCGYLGIWFFRVYQEPQYEEEEEEEGVLTEVAVYNTLLETPYKDIPQLKLAGYGGRLDIVNKLSCIHSYEYLAQ